MEQTLMGVQVRTKDGLVVAARYQCDDGKAPDCLVLSDYEGSWVSTYDDARRNGWREGPGGTMVCPACAKLRK